MKNKGCNTRKDDEFSRSRPWLGFAARLSLHSVNWKRLCDHQKNFLLRRLEKIGNRVWIFMFSNLKFQSLPSCKKHSCRQSLPDHLYNRPIILLRVATIVLRAFLSSLTFRSRRE